MRKLCDEKNYEEEERIVSESEREKCEMKLEVEVRRG
jgi:hypothetical protein